MKNKIVLFLALMAITIGLAQEKAPKFEKQGDLIKATYFFQDGSVKQIGFFDNNKLHGEWVSYDEKGNKTTIAQYEHGKKTGTWLVLANGIVKQVTYESNKVIDVKDLKETDLAFTD